MGNKATGDRKPWKPGDPVGTGQVTFESQGDREAYAEACKRDMAKARYKRVHQPQRGAH